MQMQITRGLKTVFDTLTIPTRLDGHRLFKALSRWAMGVTVLILGLLVLDQRMLGDEPVWLKPFKFGISFLVLFATLGLAAGRLSDPIRKSLLLVGTAIAAGAAFTFEMAYIAAQAARQEPSHFNETTPFHEMMYGLMGLGATTLMASIVVVGAFAWLDRNARLDAGLRLGIGLGFLITAVLTTWVAGELAGNGRHVGVPGGDHARLPLFGWSMEVGDLRPAHFLALHAMQVIPLVGHLADRMGASTRPVWVASVVYGMATTAVFLLALHGVPLIRA